MVKYACLARFFNSYEQEVKFAKENGFDFMQLWYDRKGLVLEKDEDAIEVINQYAFPTLMHAVLDLVDFEEHIVKLIDILNQLNHKELIIHPICEVNPITDKSIHELCDKVKWSFNLLEAQGITLYLENNSRLDPIFQTPQEIETLFKINPQVEFLLDIAHIDDYHHLEQLVQIKKPKILHVADRHLNVIHEHLPIGEGEINYQMIFKSILPHFEGRIILEIVQSDVAIIESKSILKSYLI